MRVGIDVTPLLRERTGIGHCAEMLLEGARATRLEVVGLISGWRTRRNGGRPLDLPLRRNWAPRALNRLFVDSLGRPSVESLVGRVDAFVWTNYECCPARHAVNIALIHDVGRLTHPQFYRRRQVSRFRVLARRLARNADVFVVPSRAVAKEVLAQGMARADRVRVVSLGADPLDDGPALPIGVPADSPFMLCVGTLERRKNVCGLLRAFRRAARRLPDHHLVFAGGKGSQAHEARCAAADYGLESRVHFLGYVDRRQIGALYRRADLTVCPSLYEGFGLTLLEAMANGCAVLASDIPPHREVGEGAVRLAGPHDDNAFAENLIELGRDDRARAELRDRGLERSRRFTLADTQRRFGELLRSRCAP